jgi:multidrug efflux pump subunit AcrB
VLDLAKIQSFGMTFNDVANALSASNVLIAVGRIEQHGHLYLIISDTRFQSFEDIGKTVLKSGPDGTILLTDVATIEQSNEPQWVRVTADGHDAVLFQVYQQPGGNTVQIAQDIKEKLKSLHGQIPEGVHLANWYDQSELILASNGSARDAVVIGVGLAALVLLVFLRNWKITLFAAVAICFSSSTTNIRIQVPLRRDRSSLTSTQLPQGSFARVSRPRRLISGSSLSMSGIANPLTINRRASGVFPIWA